MSIFRFEKLDKWWIEVTLAKSVYSKQLDRYKKTIESVDLFIITFPESDSMKELELIKKAAQKEIKLFGGPGKKDKTA